MLPLTFHLTTITTTSCTVDAAPLCMTSFTARSVGSPPPHRPRRWSAPARGPPISSPTPPHCPSPPRTPPAAACPCRSPRPPWRGGARDSSSHTELELDSSLHHTDYLYIFYLMSRCSTEVHGSIRILTSLQRADYIYFVVATVSVQVQYRGYCPEHRGLYCPEHRGLYYPETVRQYFQILVDSFSHFY